MNERPYTGPVPARARWAPAAEVAIVLSILMVGTWAGVRAVQAFRAAGGIQYFYHDEFGPAVSLACGHGLQNPDPLTNQTLDAFLHQRADAFDCASLASPHAASDLNGFQRGIRYLEIAVALTWKVVGVSWSRLAVLPGILFGAVAALTYSVLRLGLSRLWALLMLLPAVTSTSNFMLVPQLRDYAKGPFLLAVILILGVIVVGSTTSRRLVLLALAAGAVVGVGLGFRTDLIVAVFPVVLTVAFLPPSSVPIRVRFAAIAIFIVSFILVAWPVLRGYSKGSNVGHVVLLGFANDFNKPLGIEPSIYEFVSLDNDSLAFTIINSYVIRLAGGRGVDMASVEYERATKGYLEEMAAVFPADFITRGLAAIRRVPGYFLDSSLYPPIWVQSDGWRDAYSLRARIWWRLSSVAALAVAVVTLAIGATKPRAAWLIVLLMIGFAGASATQFDERHFYYLQFVSWFAFGLLAQAAAGGRLFRRVTNAHILQALRLGVIVVGIGGLVVFASRVYQKRAATRLFERYETAPRTPVGLAPTRIEAGRARFAAPEWLQPLPDGLPWIGTRFLAVRFRDDLCAPASVAVTLRYQGMQADADLSSPRTVRLEPNGRVPTTLYFPAYDRADGTIRFRGIEVPSDQARCVADLLQVDGSAQTPLLLSTILGANWRGSPLYQRQR